MLPFFTLTVIFVLILAYYIRKSNRAQEEVERNFWDRELKANETRRQDITNLGYITIPIEKIPQNLHTESEIELVELCQKRMINLTDMTNTDLKLEYGAANLDVLTEYEANYVRLIHVLPTYCKELQESGQTVAAKELLEIGINEGVTSHEIEALLAEL